MTRTDAETSASSVFATPRQREAGSTITRTTVTPAPGASPDTSGEISADTTPKKSAGDHSGPIERSSKPSFRDRLRSGGRRSKRRPDLAPPLEPYAGTSILRFIMATMLSVLSLLTVGGAILMLLLWQQDRTAGVLTTQLDRTWDLFDVLREIERYVAFAVVPVATAWIALATINVGRATGQRRSPVLAAASLPIGIAGAWMVGAEIIADADDAVATASGVVLQAIFIAVPLITLERVTQAAEAQHRPLRVTFVIAVVYLGHLQGAAGLSTADRTSDATFAELGAYLVIGALLLAIGALAANEAARSIEDGAEHRFQLRQRFGESLLAQANRLG